MQKVIIVCTLINVRNERQSIAEDDVQRTLRRSTTTNGFVTVTDFILRSPPTGLSSHH